MKSCPSCGEHTLCHMGGAWRCLECDFNSGRRPGGHKSRRDQRHYKRFLRRLDKIGARLAGLR